MITTLGKRVEGTNTFDKTAAPFGAPKDGVRAFGDAVSAASNTTLLALGAGMALKSAYDKIRNSTVRSALIEDLMMNDPILKNADKNKVMSYYATICNVAPSLSTDKNMVKYVLQRFVEIGFDLNTIEMLARTHGTLNKARPSVKDFF